MSTLVSSPLQYQPLLGWRRVWLFPNLLSLDAAIIAIVWQTLFAASGHQSLPAASSVALSLTVWLIYVADRILDGFRPCVGPETSRHYFHRCHRKFLVVGACLAVLVLAGLTRILDNQIVRNGLILSAALGIYFSLVHMRPDFGRRLCPKEVMVGLLFSAGTCLAPWTLSTYSLGLYAGVILFAALCSLNCALIEFCEWEQGGNPSQTRPHAVTIFMGRRMAGCSAAIAGASGLLFFGSRLHMLFGSLALSSLGFFWLEKERKRLAPDLLRVLADAPLLSPVMLSLLHAL